MIASSKKRDLLQFVESMLDLFDRSTPAADYSQKISREHLFGLDYFRRIEPLVDDPLRPDDWRCFGDVQPTDLTPPNWDVSCLTWMDETDERLEDGKPHWCLHRHRRVPLSEVRGKKLYSDLINESAAAIIYPDGKYFGARGLSFYVGGKWMAVKREFIDYHDEDGQFNSKEIRSGLEWDQDHDPIMALGLEFNRYYEWKVDIQRSGGIELTFTTDPIGAQEVFRLRDIPEGASRRAALRNWVMEHWRQTRTCETKVRRHLRGAIEFVWNDLKCTIRPSPDDLRLNEKYRIEREAERRGKREQ